MDTTNLAIACGGHHLAGLVPLTRHAAAPDLRFRRQRSRGAADRDQLRWSAPGTTGAWRVARQLPETKRQAGMALGKKGLLLVVASSSSCSCCCCFQNTVVPGVVVDFFVEIGQSIGG